MLVKKVCLLLILGSLVSTLISCSGSSFSGIGVTLTDGSTETDSSKVVNAPTAIELVTPSSSPSSNTTPTLKISGVVSGDTVKLYSDALCTVEIGSAIASSSTVNITVSALAVGSYSIRSRIVRSGVNSNCSGTLASYAVTATLACGTFSASNVGSVTNSIGATMIGQAVFQSGNYAYLGTSGSTNTGVQIVDISNPASPTNAGYITTQTGLGQIDGSSNDILDIFVENDYVYAVTLSGGFLVADVANKSSPVIRAVFNITGETWAVAKRGNYVYVGASSVGLLVYDVSNPNSPSLVNTIATMPLRHIQIVDDKIYGATSTKLQVISLTTATAPTLLGEFTIANLTAYETYYTNGYVYAIDKSGKNLMTYSVSNPAAISLTNTLAAGANDLRSIIGVEDKLFIATGAGTVGEIRAYSIATAATPSYLGAYALTQKGYEIVYYSGKVVTSNGDGKLQITQVCAP